MFTLTFSTARRMCRSGTADNDWSLLRRGRASGRSTSAHIERSIIAADGLDVSATERRVDANTGTARAVANDRWRQHLLQFG
jgi:hypothetical protein